MLNMKFNPINQIYDPKLIIRGAQLVRSWICSPMVTSFSPRRAIKGFTKSLTSGPGYKNKIKIYEPKLANFDN